MKDAPDYRDLSQDPADWIAAIAHLQSRDCFIALFGMFAPKIRTYLLRHGAGEQAAEELSQETLLAVWRKAGQFDRDRASAAAWIFTIARNLQIDMVRRDRQMGDGRVGEAPLAPATPEQSLRLAEDLKRIKAALAELPAEQVQVVQLSFFEDLTHIEIAASLGLPLGTVKSRIRLATACLRLRLDDA